MAEIDRLRREGNVCAKVCEQLGITPDETAADQRSVASASLDIDPQEAVRPGRNAPRTCDNNISVMMNLARIGWSRSLNAWWMSAALAFVAVRAAPTPAGVTTPDYLTLVQAYADALLTHGRDTYGPHPSALIVTCMDLRDFSHLSRDNTMTGVLTEAGYRPKDAVFRAADPHLDENFYQILYALSVIKHDPTYAREADEILTTFFALGQSPRTGLFAWGEHLGIGFDDGKVQNALWLRGGRWAARFENRPIHEFYRPWVLWDRSFELDPQRCTAFAKGLWDYQIYQHTGDFSRHTGWDQPNPDEPTGWHFPRHAGFYIATWAHAYRQTHDPVFEKAITTQLDFYDRIRDPELKYVPATGSGKERMTLEKGYEAGSNLSLALDLCESAPLVDPATAARMRSFATGEFEIYLKLKPPPAKAGWKSGYGDVSAAGGGVVLFKAAKDCPDPPLGRRLAERARLHAQAYLSGDPGEPKWLTPGNLGQAIMLMIAAYRNTGDRACLSKADDYGRYAAANFLNGTPLPRALRGQNFYHALTRGDTLMMSLLQLWQVEHAPDLILNLVYTDR